MATMREAVGERVERLTNHHATLKRKRHGYLVRPLTLLAGWLVFVVGLITIPFPGPGWLTVFIGMGILSLELVWAQRVLGWGVERYDAFDAWFHRQGRGVRWTLVVLLVILIWIVFAVIAWVMWRFQLTSVLDPVAEWLGLHR